jgi:hypothetical protein
MRQFGGPKSDEGRPEAPEPRTLMPTVPYCTPPAPAVLAARSLAPANIKRKQRESER